MQVHANLSEGVLGNALGLLSILCEKQQPEFLALAHVHASTHDLLRTLLRLASDHLSALNEGEKSENGDKGIKEATTHKRIFHCIELFADHPRYKAELIRPGPCRHFKGILLLG